MFAVIYQGYLKPGREAAYRAAWKRVASFFVEKRGAVGSCLHRAPDGMILAYSRWPDRKTRDASWGDAAKAHEMPREILDAIATIKDCLDPARPIPEICLEVVEDLL